MGFLDLLDRLRGAVGLPPRRPATTPVPPHQLPSVPAVVSALRDLSDELDHGDGVWQFNRMYLQVTELVEQRLNEGYFENDRFMERLDIVFAHLYLDTVQADAEGRAIPDCWEPVFASRSVPLAPIQFAIAGMNAHINHDLAVAVITTCEQLGLSPSSRGVRADYQKVTSLLAEVHEEVRQSFLDGLVLAVDQELTPLLTLVGSWSIGRARDAAWVNSEVLWHLRDTPLLREEFRASLCRAVGLAGRTLLVQVAEPV
ncbi:DUF5995 family protein [Ornithinimicrobium sp. F0845]|uniref:DUF5995 family protein n=1 Tax=Ornithinimicrobium sp. F0845 TaxID=2926412 RepID=UPI001FF394B1|nr:DUF5995 family protein [Ornithinimicrobium sp. F0845]MCK0113190.1 DUF5995 family protein [Ornithinimicrobium sp. F0845]